MRIPLPDIRARVVERFIFNFRLSPDLLQRHLPSGLRPLVLHGSAVASFCILDLDDVVFGPIPARLGVRNVNCAHRFAVIDESTGEPAVYVEDRNTDSRLGSFISSLGFPGRHARVEARIERDGDTWDITMGEGSDPLFSARARRATSLRSVLFPSPDRFAQFIAEGVRSYSPAVKPDMLNIVDLHKEDAAYESLEVERVTDRLLSQWLGAQETLQLDSALRTTGGTYLWRYCGQRSREGHVSARG